MLSPWSFSRRNVKFRFEYWREKSASDVAALQRHFKDQTLENDHLNPSISKLCYDGADLRFFRTKNSCGALSTSKDNLILFRVSKNMSVYTFFCLFMLLFKPSKTLRHCFTTRQSSNTIQLDWLYISRSFDSIGQSKTNSASNVYIPHVRPLKLF